MEVNTKPQSPELQIIDSDFDTSELSIGLGYEYMRARRMRTRISTVFVAGTALVGTFLLLDGPREAVAEKMQSTVEVVTNE